MKAYEVTPGIIGGIAIFTVYKFGTEDAAAMALAGFALAFAICCHKAQSVSLRAVISGLFAAPAGIFMIGVLHMDTSAIPVLGSVVLLFALASYYVGKKCKPTTITQGHS